MMYKNTNDYAKAIVETLNKKGETLGCAESITGGLIASSIVGVSGASNVFKGSIVSYMSEIKENILNIDPIILGEDAVNAKTAILMGIRVSELMNTDYGIGVTGFAEVLNSLPRAIYSIYKKNDEDEPDIILKEVIFDNISRNEVREALVHKILSEFYNYISEN